NRLDLLPLLPTHDPKAAAEELRRTARLGHRGVMFHWFETEVPAFRAQWAPLWEAANETGTPMSFHLYPGKTHSLVPLMGSWETAAFVSVAPLQMDELLAGLIFSGTLERNPKVKFVLAEGGIGWVPFLLERMDHEYHNFYDGMKDYRPQRLPSEIYYDQVFLTFQEEKLGLQLLPFLGVNNVMWASDFPHPDGTF